MLIKIKIFCLSEKFSKYGISCKKWLEIFDTVYCTYWIRKFIKRTKKKNTISSASGQALQHKSQVRTHFEAVRVS